MTLMSWQKLAIELADAVDRLHFEGDSHKEEWLNLLVDQVREREEAEDGAAEAETLPGEPERQRDWHSYALDLEQELGVHAAAVLRASEERDAARKVLADLRRSLDALLEQFPMRPGERYLAWVERVMRKEPFQHVIERLLAASPANGDTDA